MAQPNAARLRELWGRLGSDAAQQAATMTDLAAARQAPPTLQHVAQLLYTLEQADGTAAAALRALALLARWVRQQGLQPVHARDASLLHRTVEAARRQLSLAAAGLQPKLTAACLLLLGSAVQAVADAATADAIVDLVGTALLSGHLGLPDPATAADASAAVAAVLPCLMAQPPAAGWLLAALLQWLGSCPVQDARASASWPALDCLSPAYNTMRGAATTALARAAPAAAVAGLLRPAYAVLKTAAAVASPAGQPTNDGAASAAAAVLGLAGLAEGLLRSAVGYAEAAQLANAAEASLVAASDAAAAAVDAAGPAGATAGASIASLQAAQLLQDACALAAAQLASAVRRPRLASAPGVFRCQARALLHSALSLGPLCQAAAAVLPPAQAAQLLRQHAACALLQAAGSLAARLAGQYPAMDAGSQQWLVQQVQLAAYRAHQQYRQYSLTTPAAWLAAMDAAAVRQLLDRLFLSCQTLLAAAWHAASPPAGTAGASQRAQLAAAVLVSLADLQFCRLATPQYAALLTAVLGEVPGDAGAAASLAASLPCYAELAKACPARGGQPAWLADGVAAAKVQLLILALVPCCGTLPQVALEQRLAPLAFLYLLHPHSALAAAAHQLFCALLVALEPEERREPLAAYYVSRCLEGCPGTTLQLLPQFGQGLATVLQAVPVGSPVAVLCLERVLQTWRTLAASGDPAAPELAAVAAQQLLLVDHALLGEAIAAFDQLMWGPPAREGTAGKHSAGCSTPVAETPASAALAAGGATLSPAAPAGELLLREVLAVVRGTDDCLRKPVLARWLLARHGEHSAPP